MGEKIELQSSVEPVVSITKEDLEDKNKHVLTTIVSPGGKEIKITNNVDVAMEFAIQHKGEFKELIQLPIREFCAK